MPVEKREYYGFTEDVNRYLHEPPFNKPPQENDQVPLLIKYFSHRYFIFDGIRIDHLIPGGGGGGGGGDYGFLL